MTQTPRDIERLKAAAFHEVTGTDAKAAIEIDVFPHNRDGFTLAVKDTGYTLSKAGDTFYLADEWDEFLIFDHELDVVIALLTRARAIMQGGA